MWFNFFRHKKKVEDTSKTFEGRFISDEEIEKMVQPKTGTFIKREFDEINEMMNKIRQQVD